MGEAHAEFMGLAKFSKKGIEIFKEEMEKELKTNLNAFFWHPFWTLINKGHKVYYVNNTDKPWTEIDFPEDLEKAKEIYLRLKNS